MVHVNEPNATELPTIDRRAAPGVRHEQSERRDAAQQCGTRLKSNRRDTPQPQTGRCRREMTIRAGPGTKRNNRRGRASHRLRTAIAGTEQWLA